MRSGNNWFMMAFAATLLFWGSMGPAAIHAQVADSRAAEILERAQQAYERSIEGIDDYVMVTDDGATYFEKAYDNGRPYFRTHTEIDEWGEVEALSSGAEAEMWAPEMFEQFKKHARYEGRSEVDGYAVYVLFMEEMEALIYDDTEDIDDVLEQVRIYIDEDNLVMRKMEYRVEVIMDDNTTRVIEPEIRFRDYRSIEGMMVPFETIMVVEGLSEMMTPEEREEAERSLREMERELEQMPEGQRRMVERMMGERLKELRDMLAADRVEYTQTVREVLVNTGGEW